MNCQFKPHPPMPQANNKGAFLVLITQCSVAWRVSSRKKLDKCHSMIITICSSLLSRVKSPLAFAWFWSHSVLQIIFFYFPFCVFIYVCIATLSIVYFAIYGRVNLIHNTQLFLLFSHSVLSDSFVTPLDCSPPTSPLCMQVSQARILRSGLLFPTPLLLKQKLFSVLCIFKKYYCICIVELHVLES